MNPEDILVRVTADNPVVDGIFIKQLIAVFCKKIEYFSAHDNLKTVPYGFTNRIFRSQAFKKNYQTINLI